MPLHAVPVDVLPLRPFPVYPPNMHSDFPSPERDLSPSRPLSRLSQLSTDSNSSSTPFYTHSNTSTLPLFSAQNGQNSEHNGSTVSKLSMWSGWREIIFGSWLNVLLVLLVLIPIINLALPQSDDAIIFFLCLISLLPLVKLHDLGTRELSLRIGNNKTGLVNATLSNVVEIVVAVMALRRCELRVVQTMLIGSMLGKLLLVLGLCFFAGGLRFREQAFDATATQIQSSLLSMSVGAVLLPAAYHLTLSGGFTRDDTTSDVQKTNILKMSHGVSIVLLIVYLGYLLFQLWSHTYLYQDRPSHVPSQPLELPVPPIRLPNLDGLSTRDVKWSLSCKMMPDSPSSSRSSQLYPPCKSYMWRTFSSGSDTTLAMSRSTSPSADGKGRAVTTAIPLDQQHLFHHTKMPKDYDTFDSLGALSVDPTVRLVSGTPPRPSSRLTESLPGLRLNSTSASSRMYSTEGPSEYGSTCPMQESEDIGSDIVMQEQDMPRIGWAMNVALLIVVTVLVALVADELVETMDGISAHIDKAWIGLILLPTVSSVAECITAVNVSVKDQLRLSISVAVGSTIQTALFVIPFMVLLGWAMGKPLALLFDPFESIVLYISVQTTSYVVGDGKSNWLEGLILIGLYAIIAVSFWFYPDNLTTTLVLRICEVQP